MSKKKYTGELEARISFYREPDSMNEPGIPMVDGYVGTEDTYFVSGGDGRISAKRHATIRYHPDLEKYVLVKGVFVEMFDTYEEAVYEYINYMVAVFRAEITEVIKYRDE
jgi:hypothetical protein